MPLMRFSDRATCMALVRTGAPLTLVAKFSSKAHGIPMCWSAGTQAG